MEPRRTQLNNDCAWLAPQGPSFLPRILGDKSFVIVDVSTKSVMTHHHGWSSPERRVSRETSLPAAEERHGWEPLISTTGCMSNS